MENINVLEGTVKKLAKDMPRADILAKYIDSYFDGNFKIIRNKAKELGLDALAERIDEAMDISVEDRLIELFGSLREDGASQVLNKCSIEEACAMERVLMDKMVRLGLVLRRSINEKIGSFVTRYGEERAKEMLVDGIDPKEASGVVSHLREVIGGDKIFKWENKRQYKK